MSSACSAARVHEKLARPFNGWSPSSTLDAYIDGRSKAWPKAHGTGQKSVTSGNLVSTGAMSCPGSNIGKNFDAEF